jgi:hypothetical protein
MTACAYDISHSTETVLGGKKPVRTKFYDFHYKGDAFISISFYGLHKTGTPIAQSAASQFETLARTWKSETVLKSNMALKAINPAYQQIIGMGKEAIPFILQEFQNKKFDDWFWALHAIAKDEAPSTDNVAGNIKAMASVWVKWGRANGYL